MADLILTYDTINPFSIKLNDFLSSRGIGQQDLVDVIFAVKTHFTDPDESALVTKLMSEGDITFGVDEDDSEVLGVKLAYTDYGPGKLEIGGAYCMGVGFRTLSHTRWLEARWWAQYNTPPKLRIIQDFFRN